MTIAMLGTGLLDRAIAERLYPALFMKFRRKIAQDAFPVTRTSRLSRSALHSLTIPPTSLLPAPASERTAFPF